MALGDPIIQSTTLQYATVNGGTSVCLGNLTSDADPPAWNATIKLLVDGGKGIGVGAVCNSSGATALTMGTQAISGCVINDNAIASNTYAGYFETHKYSGRGSSVGVESSVSEYGTPVTIAIDSTPTGTTAAYWASIGLDDVQSGAISCALGTLAVSVDADKGFDYGVVCFASSLTIHTDPDDGGEGAGDGGEFYVPLMGPVNSRLCWNNKYTGIKWDGNSLSCKHGDAGGQDWMDLWCGTVVEGSNMFAGDNALEKLRHIKRSPKASTEDEWPEVDHESLPEGIKRVKRTKLYRHRSTGKLLSEDGFNESFVDNKTGKAKRRHKIEDFDSMPDRVELGMSLNGLVKLAIKAIVEVSDQVTGLLNDMKALRIGLANLKEEVHAKLG